MSIIIINLIIKLAILYLEFNDSGIYADECFDDWFNLNLKQMTSFMFDFVLFILPTI